MFFYLQPTLTIASELLGKHLVRNIGGVRLVAKIVETEAYMGESDLASHARFGHTKRTDTMYLEGGRAYIYLIYGMYHCLNIVTQSAGAPEAVLIRAAEPIKGHEMLWHNRYPNHSYDESDAKGTINLTNGPGKLCQALAITTALNGIDLNSRELSIEQGYAGKFGITAATRVGIPYAGEYQHKLWRYFITDNPYVSRK